MSAYDKPLPEPTTESQPYWDGLKTHRLLFQCCRQCKKIRHYPRPVCDHCFSMAYDWIESSGRGKVYSWTVNHHGFHAGFKSETPYVTVTADMEEGVRVQAPLIGTDEAEVAIDLAVEVFFDDVTPEITLPRFRAITGSI
ncbi:MAG: OB-fold domain-containing protein [Gammaproteobacteria bacterium]|nr:OB-fold domain-containing protein [Gammaproteobacteria bacterium]